jgi:oxygen-independent coproporphyrinogen-3 oxidase
MMNALRLTSGIDLTLFYERTGGSWVDIQAGVEQGVAKGLLEFDAQTPSILRPTLRGQRFLNDVLTLFL